MFIPTATIEQNQNHDTVVVTHEIPGHIGGSIPREHGAYSGRKREEVLADIALIERFGGNRQLAQVAYDACARRLRNLGLNSAV